MIQKQSNGQVRVRSGIFERISGICGRIEHCGRSGRNACTGTSARTSSITPHRVPVHCIQPERTQASANRKRFSGERPAFAFIMKSRLTTRCSPANATRPSAITIPSSRAPSFIRALGQTMLGTWVRFTAHLRQRSTPLVAGVTCRRSWQDKCGLNGHIGRLSSIWVYKAGFHVATD